MWDWLSSRTQPLYSSEIGGGLRVLRNVLIPAVWAPSPGSNFPARQRFLSAEPLLSTARLWRQRELLSCLLQAQCCSCWERGAGRERDPTAASEKWTFPAVTVRKWGLELLLRQTCDTGGSGALARKMTAQFQQMDLMASVGVFILATLAKDSKKQAVITQLRNYLYLYFCSKASAIKIEEFSVSPLKVWSVSNARSFWD